jgi:hypothetical protein
MTRAVFASVAVLAVAGSASADVITVNPNYTAPTSGQPAKTAPSGRYTTATYPNGGWDYRLIVDYGTVDPISGVFQPDTSGNMPSAYTGYLDVGRGKNDAPWTSPTQNWTVTPGSAVRVRVRLQNRSTGAQQTDPRTTTGTAINTVTP